MVQGSVSAATPTVPLGLEHPQLPSCLIVRLFHLESPLDGLTFLLFLIVTRVTSGTGFIPSFCIAFRLFFSPRLCFPFPGVPSSSAHEPSRGSSNLTQHNVHNLLHQLLLRSICLESLPHRRPDQERHRRCPPPRRHPPQPPALAGCSWPQQQQGGGVAVEPTSISFAFCSSVVMVFKVGVDVNFSVGESQQV